MLSHSEVRLHKRVFSERISYFQKFLKMEIVRECLLELISRVEKLSKPNASRRNLSEGNIFLI